MYIRNMVSVPAGNHIIYEPFVPGLTKASSNITIHYRNDTHAFIAAWTASNLKHPPFE
jgi:hypothetical protein